MISKKDTVILTLFICLRETNSVPEFVIHNFNYRPKHNFLWGSECISTEAPNLSTCALICIERPVCITFLYSESKKMCRHNCKIFWSRNSTDVNWRFYERTSQNLALRKFVFSSTVQDLYQPEFVADGDAGKCFHSNKEFSPWIEVDLETLSAIDYIKIYERWYEYGEQLPDIKVKIDENDGRCDDFQGPVSDSQVVYILCQPTSRGRKVKLYVDGIAGSLYALTICELEIRHFS